MTASSEPTPIRVESLAQAKGLDPEFLRGLGVKNGSVGVVIPYGDRARRRLRTAIVASKGSTWMSGSAPLVPYGPALRNEQETARQRGFVVLVEGESDCWVLWYHGFPAIGLPGATMAKLLEADHLNGIGRVYVVQESDKAGKNSQVYPALAKVPPNLFGICVVGTNGNVHAVGDSEHEFTIMRVSKPFLFALVCQAVGHEEARRKLGVNSTGLPFNSVMAIELNEDRTMNPMVNAGAIAATSLVPGGTAEAKWRFIQEGLSRLPAARLPSTKRCTSRRPPPTSGTAASPSCWRAMAGSTSMRWSRPMSTPSSAP